MLTQEYGRHLLKFTNVGWVAINSISKISLSKKKNSKIFDSRIR